MQMILTGISSGDVFLSTTAEAADKDFEINMVSDICSDAAKPVHRVLMEKTFPRQATVLRIAEWMQG